MAASLREAAMQSKDPYPPTRRMRVQGVRAPGGSPASWEFPDVSRGATVSEGSFDSASAPLRGADAALRM